MKKTLFILLVGTLLLGTMSFATQDNKEVPVLMYHDITEERGNPSVVSPEKFKKDMEQLKSNGYTAITLNDMYQILNNKKLNFPEKPVVITFDDGYTTNYEIAYPILKELEMKATISIIGAAIGKETLKGYPSYRPHFNAKVMKEISDSGVIDIQNHTYDLHSLKGKSLYQGNKVNKGVLSLDKETDFIDYAMRLAKDLVKNDYVLKSITGKKPNFVIYPFGAYEEKTEKTLKLLGYKGSVTTIPGIRVYNDLEDLFEIPRLNVTNEVNVLELIENN